VLYIQGQRKVFLTGIGLNIKAAEELSILSRPIWPSWSLIFNLCKGGQNELEVSLCR